MSHLKVSSPILYRESDAMLSGILISSTTLSLSDDDERLEDVSGDYDMNDQTEILVIHHPQNIFSRIMANMWISE